MLACNVQLSWSYCNTVPSIFWDTLQSNSTPLHAACYSGHTAVAELLIAEGADVAKVPAVAMDAAPATKIAALPTSPCAPHCAIVEGAGISATRSYLQHTTLGDKSLTAGV